MLRDHIRPFVLGGIDGVITSFAILAGGFGTTRIILLRIVTASLFADGISMGISEFLSVRAESQNKNTFDSFLTGLTRDEQRHLTNIFAKHQEIKAQLFSTITLKAGLTGAVVCFFSFVFWGGVIILVWYISDASIIAAIITSLISLVGLGVLRTPRITYRDVGMSIAETLSLGFIAGVVAYGLGAVIE